LSKLLLPKLKKCGKGGGRVVNVSSLGHEWVKNGLDFENLNCEKSYDGG